MSEFRNPFGFEDALRPPVDVRRARITPAVLGGAATSPRVATRVAFIRVVRGTPEVMVKITGRTRDAGHLQRHLDYISRNGAVRLEGTDGERLEGRAAVRGLAREWGDELLMEVGRRKDSPVSLSIILSMPAGTDAHRLHDSARAFAASLFGDRFPYVFALHDEGRHPHVHLTVRMAGRGGERLNPRKADLQVWRETFARELRDRSIEAEATPRRTRGVVRKADPIAIRKLRDRYLAGQGPLPQVLASAYRDAMRDEAGPRPWRKPIQTRQVAVRRAFVAEALALQRSDLKTDRALGQAIERFVRALPAVETRHELLVRDVSSVRAREISQSDGGDGRDRGR